MPYKRCKFAPPEIVAKDCWWRYSLLFLDFQKIFGVLIKGYPWIRCCQFLNALFKNDTLLFSIFLVPCLAFVGIVFNGQSFKHLLAVYVPVVEYANTVGSYFTVFVSSLLDIHTSTTLSQRVMNFDCLFILPPFRQTNISYDYYTMLYLSCHYFLKKFYQVIWHTIIYSIFFQIASDAIIPNYGFKRLWTNPSKKLWKLSYIVPYCPLLSCFVRRR